MGGQDDKDALAAEALNVDQSTIIQRANEIHQTSTQVEYTLL
jgi:hypothetical protein